MGGLLSFFSPTEKIQTDIKSSGAINNNVLVEGTGLKLEFIEALLIAVIILKIIELVVELFKYRFLKTTTINNSDTVNPN